MKKETTATVTTKARKAIDPNNRPVIPAKKAGEREPKKTTKNSDAWKSAIKKELAAVGETDVKPVRKKATASKKVEKSVSAMNAPVAEFSEADKLHYSECMDHLYSAMSDMQKSGLRFAFVLFEVYTSGLYRVDGYKNIYKFGEEKFSMSKSTVGRLIGIVNRFGERVESGKPVLGIEEKYSGYSQSQLEAMLGHTDDELKDIKPEMSVREIKRALKADSEKESGGDVSSDSSDSVSGSADGESREPEKKSEKGLLIWGFDTVDQWDTLMSPDNELDFKQLLNTIRNCLTRGHKVCIMDVYES